MATKERSQQIAASAAAILDEQRVDVEQQVDVTRLALLLQQREACHINTAKRHIAAQVRLRRGEISQLPEWGGARPGSGPKKREE